LTAFVSVTVTDARSSKGIGRARVVISNKGGYRAGEGFYVEFFFAHRRRSDVCLELDVGTYVALSVDHAGESRTQSIDPVISGRDFANETNGIYL
jgi:hypothetical protein